MKVRKATMKDLSQIKVLNQKLFHYDYKFDNTLDLTWQSKNPEYYVKRIKGRKFLALVAEDNNLIIGYLLASLIKGESWKTIKNMAELENMFVEEEHRGKGVGSALIKEFTNWAKSKGAQRTRVIASAQNERAIAAYRKNSFKDYTLTLEANI